MSFEVDFDVLEDDSTVLLGTRQKIQLGGAKILNSRAGIYTNPGSPYHALGGEQNRCELRWIGLVDRAGGFFTPISGQMTCIGLFQDALTLLQALGAALAIVDQRRPSRTGSMELVHICGSAGGGFGRGLDPPKTGKTRR